MTNSESGTCICYGYYGCSATNIAALATGHSLYVHLFHCQCRIKVCIRVFSGHEDLAFAKTTILHSTAVPLMFEKQSGNLTGYPKKAWTCERGLEKLP